MSFEPQSIDDFLIDMYELRMDEHAFGWQYNKLWQLLGLEGMPQLPDAQSFMVGTFPDYYDMVMQARSRFSITELRQNVHDFTPAIHLQGGLASMMRGKGEHLEHIAEGLDRHVLKMQQEPVKKKLEEVLAQAPSFKHVFDSAPLMKEKSSGIKVGSSAYFDLVMPKTPADQMTDLEFVMLLLRMRADCEPREQMVYGYQYERLERVAERPLTVGYRRSNVRYRMDSIENIDEILDAARQRVSRSTKPTLRVVSNGEG